MFDIVETFPELTVSPSPIFAIAEDAIASPTAIDQKLTGVDSPSTLVPHITGENVKTDGFSLGEAISEPPGAPSPAFNFDEPAAEPGSIFAEVKPQSEPLIPRRSRRRLKSIAWYAGATAIFLVLLLFLLSEKISERQGTLAGDAGSSAVAASTAPAVESIAPANENDNINVANTPSASPAPFFAGGSHRVTNNDNLWGLSGVYYRDHYLWPNIYRANTAKIENPDILQVDQALELPVLFG
jgi:nucleoid-associated protein YgaU